LGDDSCQRHGADIQAAVTDLRARGVALGELDIPGVTREERIFDLETAWAARFKDSGDVMPVTGACVRPAKHVRLLGTSSWSPAHARALVTRSSPIAGVLLHGSATC